MRCPSEGHGRECGLRPSVQSGVPRCRALSSFALAPFAFLPSRMPSPPLVLSHRDRPSVRLSARPFVRPSHYLSSSLALSWPRGTAQTAGMHQMHRADRYPFPFHRFHLFTSAVCLSARFSSFFSPRLSFTVLRFFFLRSATPPPRATLASFTSFYRRCRRRRRCHSRVRVASLPPVWWRASSSPRPRGTYGRTRTHARIRDT